MRGKKFTNGLDDSGSCDKYRAGVFIGDQIEITLAVFLFLIGQAMEFFRQGAQGLCQQAQTRDTNRKLARPGFE